MPRSSRFVSTCSTVVMMVDPPGEPSASTGLPCRSTIVGDIEDRGRLPRRMFGSLRVRHRGEVGQLVVQQEPTTRYDDAAAAGLLDRQRVRHHVAPPVRRGQMGRRQPLVVRRLSRWRRPPHTVVRTVRRPASTGLIAAFAGSTWQARSAPKPGTTARGSAPRRTPGPRHTRSVGERERRRLEVPVQRVSACSSAHRSRSAPGCSAPRRPSSRRTTTAPSRRRRARVLDLGRLPLDAPVLREVGRRQISRHHRQGGRRGSSAGSETVPISCASGPV